MEAWRSGLGRIPKKPYCSTGKQEAVESHAPNTHLQSEKFLLGLGAGGWGPPGNPPPIRTGRRHQVKNVTFSKKIIDQFFKSSASKKAHMIQKEPTTFYSKPILGLLKLPFWSWGTHFSPPKGTCWSQETTLGVLLVIRCSLWCSQGSLGALPETLGSPLGGPSAPPGTFKNLYFPYVKQ